MKARERDGGRENHSVVMRFFASGTRREDEATPLLKRGGGGGERVGTRTWLERRGSFLAVLSFLLALGTVSGGGKTVVSFLSRQGQTAARDLEYVEWTNPVSYTHLTLPTILLV